MRTIINRNTQIDILANRQGRIAVVAGDVLRNVDHAQPIFGRLLQAMAGMYAMLKRASKPAAAGAASAREAAMSSPASMTCWLPGCWRTRVTQHLAVRVSS